MCRTIQRMVCWLGIFLDDQMWPTKIFLGRLQNVVIDLEVSASTPSPTIDPSVRTVLIGHSMGGIVAAEALLSITSDAPIPPAADPSPSTAAHTTPFPTSPEMSSAFDNSANTDFMFPYIQGILAFDTPYLGISPSVIAHGAETHYKTASTAYSALSEVASVFGYGAASKSPSSPPSSQAPKLLPSPAKSASDAMAASITAKNADAAAEPAWQRWGRYAMFAGAAGAVAAGGAAAYLKRDTITEGWNWVSSHLEFVGCLMRGEELKTRLERVQQVKKSKAVGFKDLITVLSKPAPQAAATTTLAGGFVEIQGQPAALRTFCSMPRSDRNKPVFEQVIMPDAADEMAAHMSMFFPRANRAYYGMSDRAKEVVVGWVDEKWYQGSEPKSGQGAGDAVFGIDGEEGALGGEEAVLVG